MSDHWYEETCPACGARNWVNNGDVSDQSVCDVDVYSCWQCHADIRLTTDEYGADYGPHVQTEADAEYDTGRHVEGAKAPA